MAEDGGQDAEELTEEEHSLLEGVDKVLADARELKAWWDEVDGKSYAGVDTFELSATHNRPDMSFGFLDETEVAGETMPIMGNVQEQFYDHPKSPIKSAEAKKRAADWMNRQMREFVLRYFMRVSDFNQPRSYPDLEDAEAPPTYLRPISWCPDPQDTGSGFGFAQMYYKRTGSDEIHKFAEDDRYKVVDLRKLLGEYEWIVVKVKIFNFKFVLAPFGKEYPFGTVPLTESSYLVLSKDFILDEKNPEGSEDIGRYGFGYGFLAEPGESLLAYGPGQFDAAFQVIHFHVRKSGEVISRMAFVANQPRKILNVSLDPMSWGMEMANMMTFGAASSLLAPMRRAMPSFGGLDPVLGYISFANALSGGAAERQLCISRKQLFKDFLVQHFDQHYNVVAGSMVTWRQIPDWLDEDALPHWVQSGESAA